MTKICQQILFDLYNYDFIREEQIGRRHKNLSITVNELIRNYQYLVKKVDEQYKKVDQQQQVQQQKENLIEKYKIQLKDMKPLKEI